MPDTLFEPDHTHLLARDLLKALLIKAGRRLTRLIFPPARVIWTPVGVSDADGPAANVRNYLERRAIRRLVARVTGGKRLKRSCEVGCGYGRILMALKEFSDETVGFEREHGLIEIARQLLPDVRFVRIDSADALPDPGPFDLAMTGAFLQHLTDDRARRVCVELKRLTPHGHVLLMEKTEAVSVSQNQDDEAAFISRARPVELYAEYMAPYRLVHMEPKAVEPTYHNQKAGTCMLFQAP